MEIHEDLYWTHGKEFPRLSITDFYLLHFKLKSKLLPWTAVTQDPVVWFSGQKLSNLGCLPELN